jgi:hypothetical protein
MEFRTESDRQAYFRRLEDEREQERVGELNRRIREHLRELADA